MASVVEREVEFQSQGVLCRGLFVRPAAGTPAPLIVLGHGLGGVYEMRLDAYARTFAEAGYAALTFDYRRFGRSDGHPRHLLVREHQQQDFEAALDFGKALEGVDPKRVVLWGTSLAGGHVIDIAARRSDLSASIIQGPFTDGIASTLAISIPSMLGLGFFIAADVIARVLGRPPVLAPLAGTYGTPALMTKEDVLQTVLGLMPEGTRFSRRLSELFTRFAQGKITLPPGVTTSDEPEQLPISSFTGSVRFPSGTVLISGVSAIFALKIGLWRPGKNMHKLRAPMLVCVCERDSVAPPGPTIAYAQASQACELKRYPYGHFEIYTGAPYEHVTRDQLEFLARVVPVAVPASLAHSA
jgi:pimeloyl-ACP methyl ester carboxylesterase